MAVYGFLSYENGKVSIPNKELMDKFTDTLQKEPSLGYVYRLAKESERMLRATLVLHRRRHEYLHKNQSADLSPGFLRRCFHFRRKLLHPFIAHSPYHLSQTFCGKQPVHCFEAYPAVEPVMLQIN